MPLNPGDQLGHYQVLSLLGQGGMGEVYRAKDSKLDREVAIKVLPQLLARDPERLARFQREAKVLASLDHPNIGHIHGIVDTDDSHGLVLALIEGPTLADRIDLGPIPVEEAIAIAKQIIEALEYAHDRGVVHRDLKPANVKITPDGVVKVLDFGLAKVLEDEPATSSFANSPTITMGHTRAGVILGTAAYMSPEQAIGRSADRRSDIFSFGALFYEMLTGKRGFAGATTPDILEAVVKNDPDWSALPPKTPAYLKRLLERTLTKDRKLRLQAIGEARIALERGDSGTESPAQATSLPHKTTLLWPILTAASVAIAAGALAWTYLRPTPPPEVTRFEIQAPPGTTLPLGTPAVSPDGRTIAFAAADKQHLNHLYVRTLDSLEARLLPGTEGAIHPFFSPDGRSLAFALNVRTLMRIDLTGGAPRVLAELTGPWHGSWNQSGTILFQNGGVTQISASGGVPTPVFDGGFPFFLPDGKRFLTYVNTAQSAKAGGAATKPHIELTALGSKEHTLVLDDAGSVAIPAPTPGGAIYLLYERGANVMAQLFDPSSGKLLGEPSAILDEVGRVANPALMPALGVSASGTLAYQKSIRQGEGSLTWYDRTGKPLAALDAQSVGRAPVLSPDGQFAAVIRTDLTALTEDIWVVDLKRGSSSRLTFAKERDRSPIWSADGKRITFNREGVGVFEKDASGAGTEKLLLAAKTLFTRSPDGKYAIENELRGEALLIPLSPDAAGQKVLVGSVNGRNQNFEFSPDGKYIAYVSNESGSNQVYVQPTPPGTGRWQVSVSGGIQPQWRRDGKELYFSSGGELMAVDVALRDSFSAGTPHALFRIVTSGGFAAAADGQRFLVHSNQSNDEDSPIIVVQNWWAALKK